MHLTLGSQSARICAAISQQIDSGQLAAGAKLPAERALAELFSTTRITLRDALLALEAEGRVYREERRGWFVAAPRLRYNPQFRTHFQQMVSLQQRQVSTQVLSSTSVMATPALCQTLDLPALARLYQIRRLRSLDGRVVMFVEHHLIPERFPGILARDLSQSLTMIYQQHYGIEYGRSRFEITPSAARGRVARALTLAEGSPILLVFRINYDQHGQIIDCDHEYWRHDAICITVDSGLPAV